MGRFETEVLTQRGNLTELTKLSGKWIGRTEEGRNTVRLDSRRRHCACVHRLADLPLKRPLCGDYRLPICQRRKNSCNTHSIKYPFCRLAASWLKQWHGLSTTAQRRRTENRVSKNAKFNIIIIDND